MTAAMTAAAIPAALSRIAAFADAGKGGNPAGVLIADAMPPEAEMQRIAAAVGYSETAFAMPEGDRWRVRYFSPEAEVPFCGHATIALGAALAAQEGDGTFPLRINGGDISVEGRAVAGGVEAALISPPSGHRYAAPQDVAAALALFGLSRADLVEGPAPVIANAGNDHLVLILKDRARLAAMDYDLAAGAAFMRGLGLTTISLLWAEGPRRFHSRNAFAIGGVLEDPATGAAAAALGGWLRDAGLLEGGEIEIVQGEDMGAKSRLTVSLDGPKGAGLRVAGAARTIAG
ncbi:PhzF family phenazine biosynthesis protein [Rhodovulum sp. DZ06]|uniref:PhzF family phenazine biosynthesis protein n=1 Tax=Rhodovulum sp. DZ06 TaxID=3425126 RepID=UPI003D32B4B8